MREKTSIRMLRGRAKRFLACRGTNDVARLLGLDPVRFAIMAEDPKYRTFRIPKKRRGTFRLVEDPLPAWKRAQRRLNGFLQAVYYLNRTSAAYGFVVNPVDDEDPRNIKTNAERHLGATYLLNVDMRDFFHLVDQPRVEQLFTAPLFNLPKLTAARLAGLCCYKGRLPMGAPTSPAISNLISIPLDQDLIHFARLRGWVYTRYADDLSFSSREAPITLANIGDINNWVEAYDFTLNHAKSKIFTPTDDNKEVTGLLLGADRVRLAPTYVANLRQGIDKLNGVINAKYCVASGRLTKTPWVEEITQQLRGRLAFANQILDGDDPVRTNLQAAYDDALAPPVDYAPVAWLDFGYTLFNRPQL